MRTALIVVLWAVSVAAQDTAQVGTADNQTTILITSIAGFLTLLATQFFAMWKEHRNRRWDIEDRAAARAQMQRAAEVQLEETVQTAVVLAKVTEAHREHILNALSKNTEITQEVGARADAAYNAANNFAVRMEALRRELQSKAEQIDHIDEVSVDTNEKVTDIKEGK